MIVGAGLSGIGAARHLQARLPRKTYAILEARDAIGGTWDLFRYPGVRSDSDMQTLGYRFKPWQSDTAIADGPAILSYVRETAREAGIEEKIRFNQRVTKAAWAGDRWTLSVEGGEDLTCAFLYVCGGYYRYDAGYLPEWPDYDRFQGRDRPSAVLARGPRLRRRARGRDRQRRDRGDARPGARRAGRARDDAPALALLHPLDPGQGPDRQRAAQAPRRAPRRTRSRAGRTCSSRRSSTSSASTSRA